MASLLILSQQPPPLHGASLMNQRTVESPALREAYDVTLINITTARELSDTRKFETGKLRVFAGQVWKLLGAVVRRRYDIFYITLSTDGPAFYKDVLLWMIAAPFVRRRVLHFHTKGITQGSAPKLALVRFVLKRSSVIALSAFHGREVAPYARALYVLNNGIPVEAPAPPVGDPVPRADAAAPPMGALAPRADARPAGAAAPLTLLFFSNLLVEKGIFQFLDVCTRLRAQQVPFRAVIAGKALNISYDRLRSEIAQRELETVVMVKEAVYGEEKVNVLNEADILLFPTYYKGECFPLVILEAFQYGLVPVCSDEASIPEMIEQGRDGYYYPYQDTGAFAECIKALAFDRDRLRTLQANGRAKFMEKYTFGKYEENLIQILEAVRTHS
ncbi:glycosyltransferase family 4 protein [Dinghuibacter silviterrae]|uniref:Glycosyltransferase involved in cell wall biosynthesis n=1 Tax=Dinghuibacter silviterrae TaxID=1539049 RepID=A0A4R8DW95_9BACT|nr:glycosyltransferase family 4 protein [Dinghuibacter silviterrae]TDX01765.1 glycosyltransferase involved in cell wall biosynthesis [Dinghuibacter silviterrae]